jgi:hypothetical protein
MSQKTKLLLALSLVVGVLVTWAIARRGQPRPVTAKEAVEKNRKALEAAGWVKDSNGHLRLPPEETK